jgi:phosphoribosylaminoimidazole-succinocarboxamide synthase
VYSKAAAYALSKGIIIADTKFELGVLDGKLILIDEALTPDSSGSGPRRDYRPAARRRASTSSSSATTC